MSTRGENDDEIWDLYDKNRNLTGRKHRRCDPLESGEYHLVVHVCIFNSKNELLVQRRQPWKTGWPDMWDLSVGGSAVTGDDSQKAAERETKEELGIDIDLSDERPHFTINFKHGFDDYYMITKDVEISELQLQADEVQDAKWVNKDELQQMIMEGIMVPYFFLDMIFEIKNIIGARL
jgi:isopentenyldiphosphate isomerase